MIVKTFTISAVSFPLSSSIDESQTRARGQSESLLRSRQALAGLSNQPAYVPWCVFQAFIPERGYRTDILAF